MISSIKILFLGNAQAGKSSLIKRLMEDKFDAEYCPTIAIDFFTKRFEAGSNEIKLHMWDTSGQERFKQLTPVYSRGANVCVYVVDTTQAITPQTAPKIASDLELFYQSFDSAKRNQIPVLLIGSKPDLAEKQEIDVNQFLKDMSQEVTRINPTIRFEKSYAISSTKPLSSNPEAQSLLDDLERLCEESQRLIDGPTSSNESPPDWFITARGTLRVAIDALSEHKKALINTAIIELQNTLFSKKPEVNSVTALSNFNQQCDDILRTKHPVAKKALYTFALTVLCSLIALSIAMSFGISGIALLAATTVTGSALGAGAGLLTKNSLFKSPACLVDVAQFAQSVDENIKLGVPI